MLRIRDIYKSYGTKPVLEGVTLDLLPGSINGLIGPSGGGKSVLMKILGEVSRPNSGTVEYDEIGLSAGGKRHSIGLMFQEGALFDSISVFDNVAFPLVSGRVPTTLLNKARRLEVYEKVSEILGHLGLLDHIYKMPGQLSGGMRRRVSLARALVSRPELVLLDDPTAGLDPVASSVIMNLIAHLHQEYKPIMLIAGHDLRRLLPVVQKIFALYDGRIKFEGTLPDLRADQCQFLRSFVSCRFDLSAPV